MVFQNLLDASVRDCLDFFLIKCFVKRLSYGNNVCGICIVGKNADGNFFEIVVLPFRTIDAHLCQMLLYLFVAIVVELAQLKDFLLQAFV